MAVNIFQVRNGLPGVRHLEGGHGGDRQQLVRPHRRVPGLVHERSKDRGWSSATRFHLQLSLQAKRFGSWGTHLLDQGWFPLCIGVKYCIIVWLQYHTIISRSHVKWLDEGWFHSFHCYKEADLNLLVFAYPQIKIFQKNLTFCVPHRVACVPIGVRVPL